MSTFQVEEYYVHMSGLTITPGQKEEIVELLSNEGYPNYEFQNNDTVLVVDDIQSESEGETIESEIESILA